MKLRNLLIFLAMLLCQTVLAQQREHTVERGETLASIAKKYNTSISNLKKWNNLKSDKIRVKQKIRVSK